MKGVMDKAIRAMRFSQHEPRSSRRKEAHSVSAKESQSLLTSAATVQAGNARSVASANSLPVEGRGKPAPKTYFKIWLALLVLLVVTVGIARLNLSPFNTAIALLIAFAKMALILLFFMHVRYSRRVIWVFVAAGFIWLFIMIELTMSDYLTRGFAWSQ